jgi:hypothetical protein
MATLSSFDFAPQSVHELRRLVVGEMFVDEQHKPLTTVMLLHHLEGTGSVNVDLTELPTGTNPVENFWPLVS